MRRTRFQVFVLKTGLLFLELRDKAGSGGNGASGAIVAGAVLAGPLGAVIGAAIASNASVCDERETGFDLCDEDEQFELASSRKRSFVAKQDEIKSISFDAPGFLSRTFGSSSLVGLITLSDRCLGKIELEVHEQVAMAVIDALPKRLGERVHINIAFDPRAKRYVTKRA